jgi:hypothetical protein
VKRPLRRVVVAPAVVAGAASRTAWRFDRDVNTARTRAALGGVVTQTRRGPIECQEAGASVPLLAVHGSNGGHDQGMAFAARLANNGIRVIAMSRFGYLRTPMPADASADFLFWAATHVARDQVIGLVLAAPPALLTTASTQERAVANP